jgi:hypothetical protein
VCDDLFFCARFLSSVEEPLASEKQPTKAKIFFPL